MTKRSKPSLLFLSQTLPYPPDGGVAIRTYNVLKLLSDVFDVTALCFYRSKHGATESRLEESIAALERFGRVEAFSIPQEHSRPRFIRDHTMSTLTTRVYTRYAYRSEAFTRRLDSLLMGSYDLVHADSLDLSGYFPRVMHMPLVCVHHNHESRLLRRRADVEPAPLRRGYLTYQARLMAAEERRWCPIVDQNVVVSPEDASTLKSLVGGGRYLVVPNGVDTELFRPTDDPQHASGEVVFVGGSTWFPNRDALKYFAADILPEVRRLYDNVSVRWIGRARDGDRERYGATTGLDLVGYVDDIRPYVLRASCYIVPLRVGGGTRLKILDAWSMGKAVVSTSVGCEGLEARDGDNILIRDNPADFASAVNAVLRDADLRRRLGTAARQTAERVYAWPIIGRPMQEAYLDLACSSRHPGLSGTG